MSKIEDLSKEDLIRCRYDIMVTMRNVCKEIRELCIKRKILLEPEQLLSVLLLFADTLHRNCVDSGIILQAKTVDKFIKTSGSVLDKCTRFRIHDKNPEIASSGIQQFKAEDDYVIFHAVKLYRAIFDACEEIKFGVHSLRSQGNLEFEQLVKIFITYEEKLQEEVIDVNHQIFWNFVITIILEQLAWVAGLYADLNKLTAEEQVKILFVYLTDLLQSTTQLDKAN